MIGRKQQRQMSNHITGKPIISTKNYIPPDRIWACIPQKVRNNESVSQMHAIDKIVHTRTSIG